MGGRVSVGSSGLPGVPGRPGGRVSVSEAHRLIRASMFEPLPERGLGLGSARTAALLHARDALPPVVSAVHVQAVVGSPTAAEREMAELVRAGTARRVVVPRRRGGIGELVVMSGELEEMVKGCEGLGEDVKEGFVRWLRENPAAQVMSGGDGLARKREWMDALVRAGFLTAANEGVGAGGTGVYARPAERHALLSLETVARAAAGSVDAVGGEGALHAAGGTGARGVDGSARGVAVGGLRVAVPGAGAFLKLLSAALEHLVALLEKIPYREMPEHDLREKWDGGIAGDKEAALAKKARGEFVGILPGRTKKWKDFHGLAFDWVLREAVGAGLVEIFETHSVGRGVRLV